MAIPLPNLDDRGYAELLDEARALLPGLAPEWTNHNPSDPGIALAELFAWAAEMVAWRTNQLPDAAVEAFLALLNGREWKERRAKEGPSPGGLDAEVRAALLGLREVTRAVTPADYEHLATAGFEAWRAAALEGEAQGAVPAEWYAVTGLPRDASGAPSAVAPVARVRCVPRRNLAAGTEAARTRDLPGHVSVLVLPPRAAAPPPPLAPAPPPEAAETTRRAVWGFLEARRLVATRVHVVSPLSVPVRVEAVLVPRQDVPPPVAATTLEGDWEHVPPSDLRRQVLEAIARWLDPYAGGPAEEGWPFGRDVHLSELYALLEAIPAVDWVADLRLTSRCTDEGPGCVTAAEALHPASGAPIGLALAAHHLPRARLSARDLYVATAVLAVEVRVSAVAAPGVAPEALERAVGGAVRAALAPFRLGFSATQGADARAGDLAEAVRALPEVDGDATVEVRFAADPQRLHSANVNQTLHLEAGEVAASALVLHTDGRTLWT